MRVTTYEATVEDGQIRLLEPVHLLEHARIHVVVPGVGESIGFHAGSPRLARPDDAVAFAKEVAEEPPDASLR